MTRTTRSLATLAAAALSLTACSLSSGGSGGSGGSDTTSPSVTSGTSGSSSASASDGPATKACPSGGEVRLATHDSFSVPAPLLKAFTAETGCTVKVLKNGDAGSLTNKLVLTKGSPIADVVYGVDNAFAGRAVKAGVFEDYQPAHLPAGVAAHAAPGTGAAQLTPVDYGDVCVNIDTTWFASKKIAPPATLDDLTKPAYKGLFVTESATNSSPGFAFLLATIGAYGTDGWQAYWRKLMANGTKVAADWTAAYTVDFTAGGGNGQRPIVTSYDTSPPFTIPKGGKEPTTKALLDTCFRQTEYAAVLGGATNVAGARAFVDFMVSDKVQASIPENMYVYPASTAVELPADWKTWAPPAPKPFEVSAEDIDAGRDAWLQAWTDIASP